MNGIITHDGMEPFEPYWTDDVPPPRRNRRGWRGRTALGMAAAVSLIGAALYLSAPPQAPLSPTSVIASPLSDTADPDLSPLFTVDAREGARTQYEARVDAATGERRDLYSIDTLGGDGPVLRLEMRTKSPQASSLFVEIAEEAAAFGAAIERLEVSHSLATTRGPVEWSELTLAGLQRSCAGFRLLGGGAASLRGFACAATGAKIDAAAVSCLIDNLTLTQAGRDAGLSALLKGADARRPNCRTVVG